MPQIYDVSLKLLFTPNPASAIHKLLGCEVRKWLDIELPEVRNTRADLLGEAGNGQIVHLEFLTENLKDMPLRMASYYIDIHRRFKSRPTQVLISSGDSKLRMPDHFAN